MDEIKILGIVGSLRKDSYNRFALKTAQELVPDGAVLDLIELHGIPVFNQDNERAPPATVLEFKRRILAADAILFATPDMPTVNQPEVMIGNAARRFDQDGRLTDEPTRLLIQKLLVALVQLVKISPPGKSQGD